MIYLDHNATTPVAPEVLDAMLPWLGAGFGNPASDYPLGRAARAAVDRARAQVASLIGAEDDEIPFTASATEANKLALLGAARALRLAQARLPTLSARLKRQRDGLHQPLAAAIPGLRLNGHPKATVSALQRRRLKAAAPVPDCGWSR